WFGARARFRASVASRVARRRVARGRSWYAWLVRPSVSLYFAQTLDGRIAWTKARAHLSLAEGLLRAHRARAEAVAVLVGAETVRIDRPQLTVRAVPVKRQPLRVVLSTGLSLPL